MGIWDRLKMVFGGDQRAGATFQSQQEIQRAIEPELSGPAQEAQDEGQNRVYAAEKARAAAAGQSVKSYRAGYIPADEAKAKLVAGPDGMPPLRLVKSGNGWDLALPDGGLVDYKTLALRHFQIFAFRVVGMGYYEDIDRPFKFRNGQSVGVQREPENAFDRNAVAITIGRPPVKVGYVNKQRAKWAAELLDQGQKLDGIVFQNKASSPRVLLTTPEMLAYLRRA